MLESQRRKLKEREWRQNNPIVYFKSYGTCQFDSMTSAVPLRIQVSQGLMCFYHKLIPRSWCIQLPGYRAHISAIRRSGMPKIEPLEWDRYCRQYSNIKIPFYYCNEITGNDNHLWINCYSHTLERILEDIGVEMRNKYHNEAGDFRRKFHVTVGLIQ